MSKLTESLSIIVSPVNKLIDAFSKAIGTVWEPHKQKKLAEAEAYRIRTITKAIEENSNIPIKYERDGLSIDSTSYEELQKRAVQRFVKQETQRQYNLESIVEEACELLKDEVSESEEMISDDWMNRFISYAQDVSDEEVKRIWSKILAGEAKKPNSFSMRTLSILGNLSKEEALLFSKCCSLMILNFIPNELDLLNRYGLNYNDILKMGDCGLINSSGIVSARIEIGSKNKEIFYNNDYILFGSCEKNKVLNLSEFIFTATGRELSTIVCNDSNFNFILDYSKIICEKNKDISISLHKVNYIDGNSISYDDDNLLDDYHK